ncbi:MAG: dienelactone hydrolase family protein [Anaerolineae bacterium]|nr:dienelactone hydrolase family protein [Anaerolineae bacterium]
MFEASHLQYPIVSGHIQIVSDGHYLPAFWAHPEVGGPFPGLVLLHDRWGLTPHMRSQVRRFAELGLYVIAPDLFNGQIAITGDHADTLAAQVGESTLSQVTAALHSLRSHNRCNGQMGLVGWGLGARLALQTAVRRDDLLALVLFYDLPPDIMPAELRLLSVPLLGLFGEQNTTTPADTVAQLQDTLTDTGIEHHITVYPNAGRDFFCDARPAFDSAAAEDAWNQTLEFLKDKLDVSPTLPDGYFPGRIY